MNNSKRNIKQPVYNTKYGFRFFIKSYFFHFKEHYNDLKKCADVCKSHENTYKRFKSLCKRMCRCEDKSNCDCVEHCYFEKELVHRIGSDIDELKKVCIHASG